MTDDHKALVGALHKPYSHLDCEDCWYSCATLTCDERRKGDECDCGASFSNTQRKQAAAAIESLSEQLERAEAERDAAVACLREALLVLVELKRMKRRIEAGTANEAETRYYEANKESAWIGAEHALDAALSPATGDKVLVDKVFAFADLKKDWNSYGADPFPPETIQLAVKVARWLGDQWKVVPCADNSIMFYFGNEEKMIEVRTDYAAAKETP